MCASFLDSVTTKFPWSRQYLFLHHIYSVETKFPLCDKSFFGSLTICHARSIFLSILCRDNLMCVYWNSYVATSTIVSRHCFCANSSNLCCNPVFMSRQHFYWLLLQQCFLYCQHFYRDRVLSPLNLISYCSFILMLRHSLLVL